MEQLSPDLQKISNFIYDKPEVVATILQERGYNINVDNTTLQQINKLTFDALYSGDMTFAQLFDESYSKEGYLNIAVTIGLAVASSVVSGIMGSNEASRLLIEKNGELNVILVVAIPLTVAPYIETVTAPIVM